MFKRWIQFGKTAIAIHFRTYEFGFGGEYLYDRRSGIRIFRKRADHESGFYVWNLVWQIGT